MTKSILVVDDERMFCEVLNDFLARKGYCVTVAYDGDSALEAYVRKRPDAVLLDLRMPGKNGLEILQQLKEIDQDAVVIMVTATQDKEIALQAGAEGAVDCLTKPVDLFQLEMYLDRNLGLREGEE